MSDLNLIIIGNCAVSALLNERADIVWSCMPRFDSDPVFHALLANEDDNPDRNGVFSIELLDFTHAEQAYLENTPIVRTVLHDRHGGSVEVIDFAPRFRHHGRQFHPVMLVRRLRPLSGRPRIRVRLRPVENWGAQSARHTYGSNHIRYVFADQALRLTTDLSITAVLEEQPLILEGPRDLIFGPDETVSGDVQTVAREFFESTHGYWRQWVRYLNIPYEWQDAVIRAAITLKLSAYEDTGAIIAAMTTSIPEAPHTPRTWDYRYCWLRDAYFVINALNRLGKTETMERFLSFILNVIANHQGEWLQPVYRIDGRSRIDERIIETLPGYRGMGPVRVGNQAYRQKQNDVFGSVTLAAAHAFIDQRMERRGDRVLFESLEPLGEMAYCCYNTPDAGIWEFRETEQVHTFSAVMCWTACDRLAKIAGHLGMDGRMRFWRGRADEMRRVIIGQAWHESRQSFVDSFGGEHLDASLLLLQELGFLNADDPRLHKTVAAIERELKHGNFIFRYVREDDFGTPSTAFIICTFWYIDVLAAMGRKEEARSLFEELLARRNVHGLLSEDIDPRTGELWGNFPQTYSMVGLINSAMKLSDPWEDAL